MPVKRPTFIFSVVTGLVLSTASWSANTAIGDAQECQQYHQELDRSFKALKKPTGLRAGYKKRYLAIQEDLENFNSYLRQQLRHLPDLPATESSSKKAQHQRQTAALLAECKKRHIELQDELTWVKREKGSRFHQFNSFKEADAHFSKHRR